MNFTKLRIGKTLFTVLILPTFLLLCVGQAWGYVHTLTEAMGTTITMTTFIPNVVAGDTIIIDANRTSPIMFRDFVGTSGSWITITNPSDAKVTITDDAEGATLYGNIGFRDCRYFKLLGNNYGSETYGIRLTAGHRGMRILDCRDYEIAYLEVDNTTGSEGIAHNMFYSSVDVVMENVSIHHNYIHDTHTEGLYLGKSDQEVAPKFKDIQIYSNIIKNTGWDCMQLLQTVGTNNNIYENDCSNCGTSAVQGQTFGILTDHGINEVEIYRNKVDTTYKAGIIVSDGLIVSVHDNVVIDAGATGIKGSTSECTTIDIINNTVISSTGYGIDTKTLDSGTGTISHNLLVANGSGGISSNYGTQTDNRISSSVNTEYFVNAGSGNFHLTKSSPAKDAGTGGGYSTTDYDGNTRPNSGTDPDIGAYEYYGDIPSPVKNLKIKTTND